MLSTIINVMSGESHTSVLFSFIGVNCHHQIMDDYFPSQLNRPSSLVSHTLG